MRVHLPPGGQLLSWSGMFWNALLRLTMAVCLAGQSAVRKPVQVEEHVAVERVVITGHVIDKFAKAIPGLVADDFRVSVDGTLTPIESVEWIPAGADSEPRPPIVHPEEPPQVLDPRLAPHPRLTVMLFQWEIAGQKDVGFVRMMRQAKRLVEASPSDDRFAVFGFGSSLRLLQDFTNDRASIERAILSIRSLNWKRQPGEAGGPTIAAGSDECGKPDSIEAAFTCIGTALQRMPGSKALLFFGWTAATTRDTWRVRAPAIIEAVAKAETSVFVLDVSDGRRSKVVLLESLKTLAFETGGSYQETYVFPDLARQRVQSSLDGYYELTFRNPGIHRGWHEVEIELTRRVGTPLFRRWFQD